MLNILYRMQWNKRISFIKDFAKFIKDYYLTKFDEYWTVMKVLPSDRTEAFVKFVLKMQDELKSFPYIDFEYKQYKEAIQQKKEDVEEWENGRRTAPDLTDCLKTFLLNYAKRYLLMI